MHCVAFDILTTILQLRTDIIETVSQCGSVSEMIYTVSSGTLNPSIPHHSSLWVRCISKHILFCAQLREDSTDFNKFDIGHLE